MIFVIEGDGYLAISRTGPPDIGCLCTLRSIILGVIYTTWQIMLHQRSRRNGRLRSISFVKDTGNFR